MTEKTPWTISADAGSCTSDGALRAREEVALGRHRVIGARKARMQPFREPNIEIIMPAVTMMAPALPSRFFATAVPR